MQQTQRPQARYNAHLLAEDMGEKGWMVKDLARAANVAEATVYRFLRNDAQTAKMAGRLARALGFSPRRYLIREAVSQAVSR